uniref:ATMHX n=1 Tax=Arundo donax TaxID=35708 RepID=A0A0A8XTA5_ARUDO
MSFYIIPETLREENTTKTTQRIMKYTDVIQAHSLGPPSSAPSTMRRRTKTVIQPNDVAKKTRREKLRPSALSMYRGSL